LVDHVIVLTERHLKQLVRDFFDTYYHDVRCHQALGGNSPNPRPIQLSTHGKVTSIPVVAGLHHRYLRVA
jgi:hypothetical protein